MDIKHKGLTSRKCLVELKKADIEHFLAFLNIFFVNAVDLSISNVYHVVVQPIWPVIFFHTFSAVSFILIAKIL